MNMDYFKQKKLQFKFVKVVFTVSNDAVSKYTSYPILKAKISDALSEADFFIWIKGGPKGY